ncbi:winged helix-turn-helix domain-containing protein [Streptomyces sp. NPDC014735]|uniref:AfsR/SARP family transcriptional regulator n=1 Tax=unclassified Streptomyces TaxID=2593676 RepID=UPI0036FAE3D2
MVRGRPSVNLRKSLNPSWPGRPAAPRVAVGVVGRLKGVSVATLFGILGTIEVRRDGVPVDAGHAVQRRVLAALLVDAERVVSADALVDRVWGDAGTTSGRTKLYGYVSRLRQVLAGRAAALTRERGGGYRLAVEPASVDVHRFRELSGLARKAGTDERAEGALARGPRPVAGQRVRRRGHSLVQRAARSPRR